MVGFPSNRFDWIMPTAGSKSLCFVWIYSIGHIYGAPYIGTWLRQQPEQFVPLEQPAGSLLPAACGDASSMPSPIHRCIY
jgi:hypothetical protein